ncbi:hypothetical protein [Rhodococcus sp. WAY2]|uniref:hypothetical protein n=1 Tax=Rhodococcus sp. WAY2 TaxID=2663121 RepID=UPI001F2143E9|nr:hypothetical protein [Rhodococcus sp. WAY2]
MIIADEDDVVTAVIGSPGRQRRRIAGQCRSDRAPVSIESDHPGAYGIDIP